jgi:hypothetical protein
LKRKEERGLKLIPEVKFGMRSQNSINRKNPPSYRQNRLWDRMDELVALWKLLFADAEEVNAYRRSF